MHPNVTIDTVLQSTNSLIPAFTSAAAAKSGPDIQYFWGGTYTLEPAWQGALIPINNLIPADELSHYINNWERTYNGQQWGIGWYFRASRCSLIQKCLRRPDSIQQIRLKLGINSLQLAESSRRLVLYPFRVV